MNRPLALAILLVLAACGQTPPPPPAPPVVGTVIATSAAGLVPEVRYVGTLAGDVEVDLSFKLAGRVALLGPQPGRDWREGDPIAAGTVLARLDTAQLDESVHAAEARALNDAALHDRGAKLIAEQRISQQEFDKLVAARDASAAELRKAQASLADATLTTPTAGTVLRRQVRSGETVAAGTPVLRLADLARMSVELGVAEQIVPRLHLEQPLSMTVAAYAGAPFTGRVSEIGAAASTTSRLFRVRIAVDNADGRLRSGMSATVAIPGDAPPADAVTVPLSALLADAEGRRFHVFTIDAANCSRARTVTVVDVIANAAVVSGLGAGNRIVTVGAGLCADGMRVEARAVDPDAIYRKP